MQAVASDDAKRQWRDGKASLVIDHHHAIRALVEIFIASDLALSQMPRDLGDYRCEMRFSPDNFLVNSV